MPLWVATANISQWNDFPTEPPQTNSNTMPVPTGSFTFRFAVGTVLILVSLWNSPAVVHAQVNGRIAAGGVQRYRAGHWGLVAGAFYNTSEEDETVTTVVTPNGSSGAQFVRSLVVPAGAVRQTAWPVRLDDDSPDAFEFHLLTLLGDSDSQEIVDGTGGDFTDSFLSANPASHNLLLTGYCGLISTRTESPEVATAIEKLQMRARAAAQLETMMLQFGPEKLHGYAEALEPLDQLLISSPDLPQYPEACDAVRAWIQRGGRVLFLLDQCGSATVNAILGEALPISIVDKTTPMEVPFKHDAAVMHPGMSDLSHVRNFEEPVSLTRAVFETGRVHFSVRDWPALVEAPFGRGAVFVSMVSPEAMLNADSGNGLDAIATPIVESLFLTPQPEPILPNESLAAASEKRIGYEIPSRGFAILVLSVFTLLVGGLGYLASKRQRPALLLLGIPLLSVVAAGPGVIKGIASRSVAPPTFIESRVAVLGDGQSTFAADGAATIYQPSVGQTSVDLPTHTLLYPTSKGAAGMQQRYVWSDTGNSKWTNFSQPAGATTYQQRSFVSLPEPMSALAEFGADGVEITLANTDQLQPEDLILASLSPDKMALQPQGTGQYSAGPTDVLAPGEVSRETLLSESQIMHGRLMQTALHEIDRLSRFPQVPSVLFWTHALPPTVQLVDMAPRTDSLCLVALPLRLQIPPADELITIPTTFMPYRAIQDIDGSVSAAYTNRSAKWLARETGGASLLQFEVPDVCQPFEFESAEVQFRVLAGSRTITLQSGSPDDFKLVETLESPVGNFTFAIPGHVLNAGPKDGSFLLRISVSEIDGADSSDFTSSERDDDWKIERVLVTVRGRRTSASTSNKKTEANE